MEVSPLNQTKLSLIEHYARGGNSFESVSVWLQQWLWQNGLGEASDLMISKLLLNQDWSQCARQYGLLGRKQLESTLRSELQVMLAKFTV